MTVPAVVKAAAKATVKARSTRIAHECDVVGEKESGCVQNATAAEVAKKKFLHT
jgi:hypothetical protein